MASRFNLPFADVGQGISPSDGAKLFFFEAGTSTPKDTFSDENISVANANPVIADSAGVFSDIWLPDGGRYKVQLKDKNDVQIWESDPVVGQASASLSVKKFDTVAQMVASTELNIGDIIETSGYISKGDKGDNRYEVVAAATGTVDGGSFINLATHQAKGLFPNGDVYVQQFGAVGDGATDDAAEIQAAATFVNSNNGGTVFIPEGVYVVSSPLVLFNNLLYKGASPGVAGGGTEVKSNGNFAVFSGIGTALAPIENAGVCDLTIRGGWQLDTINNTSAHGIVLKFGNRSRFENIRYFACRHANDFDNCFQVSCLNLHPKGAGSDQNYIGFYQDESDAAPTNDNAIQYVNCVAQAVNKYGFRMLSPQGTKMVNCEALDGEIGLYVGDGSGTASTGAEFLHVSNFLADTNSVNNIKISKGSSTFLRRIHMTNVWCGTSGEDGVVISGLTNGVFSNWLIVSSDKNGVNIDSCSRVQFSGSQIVDYDTEGTGFSGFKINDSSFCQVNTCQVSTGSVGGGVSLLESGTSNNNLFGNNVLDEKATVIGANTIDRDNFNFANDARGSATVLAANTSVTVTHGLDITPTADDITLTSKDSGASATKKWVTNPTSTTFDINVDVAPGSNIAIAWHVHNLNR